MEKGALSSDDEDPDIPNFKTYLADKLIQAKMYKNVSKYSPFFGAKIQILFSAEVFLNFPAKTVICHLENILFEVRTVECRFSEFF